MGRARLRRRASAAILLSGLARRRKIELRLARRLEEPFLRVLDAARRSAQALETVEAFLRRVNAALEEQRGPVRQVVRGSGEASAQQGYDRTLKDLRRLGVGAEDRPVSQVVLDETRRQLDDETYRRLDPLPDRLLKSFEFLRSKRSLRPWAKKLARGLAKAASTYSEVRGELAANEEQGTGWWEWVNVGDDRVRKSHSRKPVGVGGEVRQVGVLFSNGCRYPRDPLADISEVAECRCRTRPVLPPTGGDDSGTGGVPPGEVGGEGSGTGGDEKIPYEAAKRIAEHAIANNHEIPGLGDIESSAARLAYTEYVYGVGKRIEPHVFAGGTKMFWDSNTDAVIVYNPSARYNEGTMFIHEEGGLRYYLRMQETGRAPQW